MKPILQDIFSPGYDLKNSEYIGEWEEVKKGKIFVEAVIGPDDFSFANGIEFHELFDFFVCTPEWVEKELRQKDFIYGREMIVVKELNFYSIYLAIENLCKHISGNSWAEIVDKLRLYTSWENDENYFFRIDNS